MKRFFTLIAGMLLMGGVAFAQEEYVDLVVNGNMEGEQNPEWSSFWCHDFPTGEVGEEQRQGFADIVEDPTNPANHCARVIARSEAVADAAENKVTPDGSSDLASWDCQFFIYATETIPEGKLLRMTLKVRAEKDGNFETQAHYDPGNYNHWQMFGNIDVTTEWKQVQVTAVVSADHTQEANGKFMQSVAFNLSTDKEGNVFYFDDVKLEIKDQEQPGEFEGWFNMLRHGTLSQDAIGNRTNFTGRDGVDGVDRQARLVDDPTDGQPALNVTSIGWNAKKINVVVDEETGEETTEEVDCYVKENGDTLTSIDNWQSQFFITIPHKFAANSKYRVAFWARADQPATVETQAHRMPGDYIHWQLLGNLDLTEEWQYFEFDDMTVSSDQSGQGSFQTIAFNCNVPKDFINYYFRVDEFSANKGDVKDAERILASEDIALPMPEPDKTDGVKAYVNMTPCVETLEVNSFDNLLNDDHLKVLTGDETYSEELSAATGITLNEAGLYDDQGTFILEPNAESSADNAEFTIYNLSNASFADKKMETQLLFEYKNWYYRYNVTIVPEETYNGITETKATKAQGTMFDLSGRRIQNAVKGLYIMDGKKYIVK